MNISFGGSNVDDDVGESCETGDCGKTGDCHNISDCRESADCRESGNFGTFETIESRLVVELVMIENLVQDLR